MNKLKRKIKLTKKRIFNKCASTGLISGQTDYTKFIILSRGRSGSNWLRTLLQSNKNIRCYGELFNDNSLKISSSRSLFGNSDRTKQILRLKANPNAYLRDEIYAPMPQNIEVVGFKLFYYHAKNGGLESIWEYLRDTDIKVIHLMRRNLLASCLSTVVAAETGNYKLKLKHKEITKRPSYELSYETCLRYFEATREFQKKYSNYFTNTLNIFYEDLVSELDLEAEKIQLFLGIEPKKLNSEMKIQNKTPLNQKINNFHELKTKFIDSDYSSFFKE